MKKITVTTLILLLTLTTKAQTATPFVTGLIYQVGLEIKDNTLYFLQQGLTDAENIIHTVDITETTPTATVFMDNISSSNPHGMLLIEGNMLYYSDFGGNVFVTDITDTNHTITLVTSGLQRCGGLAIRDNYLYISTFDTGKIVKLNLADTFPTTTTDVVTGLFGTADIEFNGDELYISGAYDNEDGIFKINVTETTPTITAVVLVVGNATGAIHFIGNEMYFAEITTGKKISKIDITDAFPPTKTDVVIDLGLPTGFVFDGDDIYITEYYSGISKFTQTLSVNDNLINSVAVYPNPTSNTLTISGLENVQSHQIYNVIGKEVITTPISQNNSVDVSHLKSGIYFIKITNNKQTFTKKFIKQ